MACVSNSRAPRKMLLCPFERRYGLKDISRDWNSYAVAMMKHHAEILARHGLPGHEHTGVVADYLDVPNCSWPMHNETFTFGRAGAFAKTYGSLQIALPPQISLRRRTSPQRAGLWHHVSACAHGADGGGTRCEILTRAMEQTENSQNRIVYIGDNLNDVELASQMASISSVSARIRPCAGIANGRGVPHLQ